MLFRSYVSELTWTSEPGEPVGWTISLGDYSKIADLDALLARNAESVRGVVGRLSTFVGN